MPGQQFDMQKSGQSETGGRFLRSEEKRNNTPWLERREEGLALTDGEISLIGDFSKDLRRLKPENLNRELIVKAARKGMAKERAGAAGIEEDLVEGKENLVAGKDAGNFPLAIDATAGLGEDSLLLAACGFRVKMFEYNPIIAELLKDALDRASRDERLAEVVSRMELIRGNSIEYLNSLGGTGPLGGGLALMHAEEPIEKPDIILLDPMFPERRKSGMVKKKFQLLQQLESPAQDEEGLLAAAIKAGPRKIIIKRPAKAPYLAGIKPSYSLQGNVIRIDCVAE